VNALAAAPMGGGRVLVLSGGDDQALHAALLAFDPDPDHTVAAVAAPAVSSPWQGGLPIAAEGSAAEALGAARDSQSPDDAETHMPTLEPPQTGTAVVMNRTAGASDEAASQLTSDADPAAASGLRGHAAALEAQTRPAVLECRPGAHTSAATADSAAPGTMRDAAVGVRLLGSCRVANAHLSALRGAWTDGCRAVTVGLDQRVRVWGLEVQRPSSQQPSADIEPLRDDGAVDVHRRAPQLSGCNAAQLSASPHQMYKTIGQDHPDSGDVQNHEHL
jgi:hypothetical protein